MTKPPRGHDGHRERAKRFLLIVGQLIKGRRNELGITQSGLARDLGVSQQQVVKYEKGDGRIPSDSLYRICEVLNLDPTPVFYPLAVIGERAGFAEGENASYLADADRDTLALVQAFERIADKDVRKNILDLAQALADTKPAKPRGRRARTSP